MVATLTLRANTKLERAELTAIVEATDPELRPAGPDTKAQFRRKLIFGPPFPRLAVGDEAVLDDEVWTVVAYKTNRGGLFEVTATRPA